MLSEIVQQRLCMMKESMKLTIGEPEHGWLPLVLEYGAFQLELDVSDVPTDPIKQLCDTLIQLNKGIVQPDRIIWHLEPYCYYLQLEMVTNGYEAQVLESDTFDSPTTVVQVIHGTFETLILPLYRSLKKFHAEAHQPPHWEELDSERIKLLTDLIKDKKNTIRPKKL